MNVSSFVGIVGKKGVIKVKTGKIKQFIEGKN